MHRFRLSDLLQDGWSFLSRTGIARPRPKDFLNVQVHGHQRLFEGRTPSHQFPVCPKHHAVAIENQLVLSANTVQVSDEQLVVRSPGSYHLFPLNVFAGMKWRGVDVDDQFRSRFPLDGDGPRRKPNVLADSQPHRNPVHDVYRTDSSGTKIPVFVKHSIVGQVHLLVDVN